MKQITAGLLAIALTTALNVSPAYAAPSMRTITVGDDVAGEITSATALNYSDGSRSQVYALPLTAGQAVSLKIDGPLNSALSLFHRDNLITRVESEDRTGARASVRADRAGTYLVAVSGADARAFGPFRLSIEPIVSYSGEPLTAGKRITDWLTSPRQSYALQVEEPGLYTISMDSTEFDAKLFLSGGGLQLEDDDSGTNTNARLSVPLQPGSYTLGATAFSEGSGAFDLAVERVELPEGLTTEDGTELPVDGMSNGYINGEGSLRFVFRLPEPRRVQIDASSRELDTFLTLEGQGIALSDDDSGGGNNARLSTLLGAGEYSISVSTRNDRSGVFQLAASTAPVPEGSAIRIALRPGREHAGMLHPGMHDLYTIDIARKGGYVIHMKSTSSLDGMVTLMRDGKKVASQDDSDHGLDPELEIDLDAGQYVLAAHSFDPEGSGSYQISVTRK